MCLVKVFNFKLTQNILRSATKSTCEDITKSIEYFSIIYNCFNQWRREEVKAGEGVPFKMGENLKTRLVF